MPYPYPRDFLPCGPYPWGILFNVIGFLALNVLSLSTRFLTLLALSVENFISFV